MSASSFILSFVCFVRIFIKISSFLDFRHDIQTTANTKILITKKDLQKLTDVVRHGDKQQKLQVEKLTSQFKEIVEMYSELQKVCYSICIFAMNQR